MERRKPGIRKEAPVNTLRIINMRGQKPGFPKYSSKDRVFIGGERDLRWLAELLFHKAKLPNKRMELKKFRGELIDIYEFPTED